jgi:hypothetical protein
MTTFDERKLAFENKYAHDEEMLFKAQARRDKMLGLWAAEQLGLSGAAAEAYADSVVSEDLLEAGDEIVYRKVSTDLEAKGKGVPERALRRRMDKLMAEAKARIMAEQGH